MKKTWDIITTIAVVLVVLLTIALVGVRLAGLRVFTVLSGSMEPTYHVGSVIYVKKVDTQHLQPGDPITFLLDEDTVVTHRIIEVLQDEEDRSVVRYRTQGDANNYADGTPVHYKNVLGMPIFTIPYLGYISDYVSNPPGRYYAIGAAALIVLLTFLPDLFDDGKEETEEKKSKKKNRTADTEEEPENPRRETRRRTEDTEEQKNSRRESDRKAEASGKSVTEQRRRENLHGTEVSRREAAHSAGTERRVKTAEAVRTAAKKESGSQYVEPLRQRENPVRQTEEKSAEEFDFDAFLASLEEELK